ncbi:kinase-like protein [Polyplosphaeria fusca]|uniref:Kinase-like protein n=1 Tax=Polyplosphaeria fusca TaxID=682080 RepID=A0A9P4R0H9_9PLEO|nr:kinase-like protein [Polyplosphaeria fusca]
MTLRKKWTKGKLTISSPAEIVHTGHGSHDDITQKLQGLPSEWVAILRENGVVGEDLVLPKKSKSSGLYGNSIFNLSSSSLLSNRSLQKLLRGMSGKRRSGSINSVEQSRPPAIEEGSPSDQTITLHSSMPQIDSSLSPFDMTSSDLSQSPGPSRQPTFEWFDERLSHVEQVRRDCGIDFKHQEFDEIKHSFLQVVDSLGHGSLGVVEEVRVSSQYPSFVRKRVQIPYNKRKQYLKIIKQEAEVLQSLSHCHIVKMIGSYSEVPDAGRQFYSLLMAPVGQRDLRTFLDILGDQSGSQTEDWKADRRTWLRTWFKCLASALAYAHRNGVRHQDIKPSNIIHRRSAIYFTDFSSASQFQIGQTTSTENPARTSAMYAAPEVVNSDEAYNRHGRGTDVFALGAVFTEMLAVLRGRSVEEYHQFLTKGGEEHDAGQDHSRPVARQSFLYGRKGKAIKAFFQRDEFYQANISSMLADDRERRPNAEGVANSIRSFEPWILRGCECDLIENG